VTGLGANEFQYDAPGNRTFKANPAVNYNYDPTTKPRLSDRSTEQRRGHDGPFTISGWALDGTWQGQLERMTRRFTASDRKAPVQTSERQAGQLCRAPARLMATRKLMAALARTPNGACESRRTTRTATVTSASDSWRWSRSSA
jgi:hypothetical protein